MVRRLDIASPADRPLARFPAGPSHRAPLRSCQGSGMARQRALLVQDAPKPRTTMTAPTAGTSPESHGRRRPSNATPPTPATDALVTDIAGGPLAAPAARRLVTTFAPEMSKDSLDDALLVIS